ncbi:hypothetical protein BJ944DRAFT_270174 [Cunninghamella echinulata]|nr:hypothetical protein BJ944DRAFT_270174 [Cunninghamella echinulata]
MALLKIIVSCILLICSVTFAFAEEAYFTYTADRRDEFTFKLTDSHKIEEARKILRGEEKYRIHPQGRIIKRPAPYNRKWTFHFDPNSINFMEVSLEVCDASAQYVEDHLDEACGAFLPGCYWCPWGGVLLKEVTPESYTYNKVYNVNQFILDGQEQHHCRD